MPGPSHRSRGGGKRRYSYVLPRPFSYSVVAHKFNKAAKKSRRNSRIKNAVKGG